MNDRDQVLSRVRSATAARPRSEYPTWETECVYSAAICEACDPVALFVSKFEAVGGKLVFDAPSAASLLKEATTKSGYVDPALLPLLGDALTGYSIDTTFDRSRVDEYAFGITRATAGVAESGSLILTGNATSSRLGALAPWMHIAVLQRSKIVRTIPDALALFCSETNALFVTGPSKTADVEGILIKGVHGPGVQICWLV